MLNDYKKQIMAGRVYAKTQKRQKKLLFAQDGIYKLFDAVKRVYVSISFGKQSLCLAHMVYRIEPSTPMYFLASDETWEMYNYREVIDQFVDRWPIKLNIVQTHNFWGASSWKESRDYGDKDLQKMCPRENWDGWFWGLAKDESRARKISCSKNNSGIHPSIFRYSDGKLRGTPIQDWNIDDLSAYIAEYDIPMLNIYRKFGLQQRTTARITKKARDFGSHTLIKATNLNGFRKLVNTHREIEQ